MCDAVKGEMMASGQQFLRREMASPEWQQVVTTATGLSWEPISGDATAEAGGGAGGGGDAGETAREKRAVAVRSAAER